MPIPKPFVTIVVAGADNARQFIECLQSIDIQGYEHKRIVFIDDASEASLHRVALGQIYRPFQQVQQDEIWAAWGNTNEHKTPLLINRFGDRLGKAFSKNWGLKTSWDETDLYLFLDGTEILADNCVSMLVEQFLKYPETTGALYGNYIISENGKSQEVILPSYRRDDLVRNPTFPPIIMATKAAIDAVGIFDVRLETLHQYDMALRISEHFNVAHVPEFLFSKAEAQYTFNDDEIEYLQHKTKTRMSQ